MRTHRNIHTQTHRNVHTHTYIHTDTQTHTHTHTHTHTFTNVQDVCNICEHHFSITKFSRSTFAAACNNQTM